MLSISILSIILLTVIVIVLFLYFSSIIELSNLINLNLNTNILKPIKTNELINPKDELINYFGVNWNKLEPILIKNDCYDEYVPQEILDEFNNKFGHYFRNKNEEIDPVLTHFSNGTYERNFKKEIQEICKTLNSLSDFLKKNSSLELNQLGKEIERLHTEHFPQAVFIAVILDRMLEICKKYSNYNINQIADTKDLLTMSIILSLTSKTN